MMTLLADKLGHAPRRTLAATLLFLVLAAVFGGPVAGALDSSGGFAPPDADSVAAIAEIEAATGQAPSPGVVLLVDGGDPARVDAVADRLAGLDGIAEVVSGAGAPPGAGLVSEDGTQTLVLGTLAADGEEDAVAERVLEAFEADDDVAAGGGTIAGFQLGETIGEDLARAETLALPILVVLSVLFFGGRASWMPLLVGATTVLGTFLALAAVNQVYNLSVFALNLVIGLGLGLAIDYTLFLVTRYREEVARQGATTAAIVTTMRTAGRTVAFSAVTVAVALATLTVFPLGFLTSMGIAGAVVALVAAAAALVVSPALFGLWGDKLLRRSARRAVAAGAGTAAADETQGRWYRLSHGVMRRPGAVAGVTMLVMLVLAAPALSAVWTPVDSTVVPTSQSARTVSDAVADDFGGSADSPMTISVTSDDPAAVTTYAAAVAPLDGVRSVADPVRLDADSWQLDVAVAGEPSSAVAQDLVEEVRDLPTAVDAKVAGPAADFVDQQAAIGSRLPLAVALLVGLTLVVLWLMTGSVVLPVKAVLMNVLTVASALGALVFVYQNGRFADVLGYTPNGGVEPTDFLVTAALVFALSTDYGVFLLGRIKESRDAGLGERESVAVGLQRTGSVVTAAAILLAVAIGSFATSSISFIQQIGVATAVGVLLDAFVVRSLLVPALMGLLGKWNWWAPMPLRRLHDRIGFSEELPVEGGRGAAHADEPELVGGP
jgi:RND superfamily putative drug exporter